MRNYDERKGLDNGLDVDWSLCWDAGAGMVRIFVVVLRNTTDGAGICCWGMSLGYVAGSGCTMKDNM